MTPLRRWSVVALVTAAVVAVPLAPRLVPADDSGLDAAKLLERVAASPQEGWSGYVRTAGRLQLPAVGDFDDLGGLLGETTRMRVWWRSQDSWRVDRLLTAGESDLRHQGRSTVAYSYEAQQAEISQDPDIRLPRTSDLIPTELARRFVVEVDPAAVSALPARRIGGTSAAGLRVDGNAAGEGRSTIGRVDLWADPDSGVPLLVEVYAVGGDAPAFTSEVLDYDPADPPADVVALDPTAQTEVDRVEVLDIADAANQYAPVVPPPSVAGLAKQDTSSGAVGVYGSGLTQLIAIPLRDNEADPLREQIAVTPGAVADRDSIGAAVGPLGVLLGGRDGDGGWLVAGTLSQDTLRAAEADLRTETTYREDGR